MAKNTTRGYFILCEGNIDVITLHQAGFDNAVASMGTSLTQEQIALMTQYNISEVVVCYDSDNAGIKATERAIEELDKRGVTLGIVRIPDGKDVDDYIKVHGAKAFESVLEKRDDDVSYRLNRLEANYDLTKEEQRADYLRKAIDLFAELDAVRREIYAPRVAKTAQVTAEFITRESEKLAMKLKRDRRKGEQRENTRPLQQLQSEVRRTGTRYDNPKSAIAEEGIIRVLMNSPELLYKLDIAPEEFTAPELGKILSVMLQRFADGLPIEPAKLAGELSGDEMAAITRICDKNERLSESSAALADYISVVRREKAGDSLEQLIAFKKEQIDREEQRQ